MHPVRPWFLFPVVLFLVLCGMVVLSSFNAQSAVLAQGTGCGGTGQPKCPTAEPPQTNAPQPSKPPGGGGGSGGGQAAPGTSTPDFTGTAIIEATQTVAQQTAEAQETAGALAAQAAAAAAATSAAGAQQTLSAAQTALALGTLEAGTAVVNGEHDIGTANAATFAARTLTAEANSTMTPTSAPRETATLTPTPKPTAGSPSSGNDMFAVLSSYRDIGIIAGAGIVLVAVLGLLVAAVYYVLHRPTPASLAGMAIGDRIPILVPTDVSGKKFPLPKSPATIGRDKGHTVRIDDSFPEADTVSHQHARIERRGERWVLVDGAKPDRVSTNGIFVNGKRTRENYLKSGDRVRFGKVEFTFTLGPKAK